MGKLKHGHNDKLPEGWKEVGPNVIKPYWRWEVPKGLFLFVGLKSENKRVGGNVTHTVAIQQLSVGKLEHGHNDKLPEG